jgi:hypothetical protein
MTCIDIGHAQNLISPLIWIIIGSDGETLSPDNPHWAYNTISGMGLSSFLASQFQNWGHLKMLPVAFQHKNYILIFSNQRRWGSQPHQTTEISQSSVRVPIIRSRNLIETFVGTTREQLNRALVPIFLIPVLPKWFDLLARSWQSQQLGKVEMAREAGHSPPQRTSGACLPDMGRRSICQGKISLQNNRMKSLPQHGYFFSQGLYGVFLSKLY